VPRARTVAALCEGGYRAGLAAGLLERAGLTNIAIVQGGMRAVRGLEAAVS
jgi:rhodanese-related sulfurtransferase